MNNIITHCNFWYHIVTNPGRKKSQHNGPLLLHHNILSARLTRLQFQLRVRILLPLHCGGARVQHALPAVHQQLLLLAVRERRLGPAVLLLLRGRVAVDTRARLGGFLTDSLVGLGLWDDVLEELEVVVCGDSVCWGVLGRHGEAV